MKEVHLTKNYTALVDDEDFGRVSQHNWHANDSPLTDDEVDSMFDFFYAVHNHLATGPQQPVFWWRCYGIKENYEEADA